MPGAARKPTIIRRDGELYNLLERAFPEYRSKQDLLAIPQIADEVGFRHETIYKAVRHNATTPNVALKLLELAHKNQPEAPRLHWEDLLRFVLPEFDTYSREVEAEDDLLA